MKLLVFETTDGKEQHAYDFVIEENDEHTLFHLFRSNSSLWLEHCRGEHCLTINGNGMKIVDGKKKLDYAQAGELRLVLNCIHVYESNVVNRPTPEYKIIKEEILAEI